MGCDCGPTSGLNGQVVGVTVVLLVAFYPCPGIHYSIHFHSVYCMYIRT